MNPSRLALLLLASVVAAWEANTAEPAGGPPPDDVAAHPIGPQPGPERPVRNADNPYADDPQAVAEGRRLFIWFNCSGCHGGRGGGGMGPSLRDAEWLYGHEDQDVYDSIAQGRAHGMPAWGLKLPAEQIWKLTSYIATLGTSEEPDAPPRNPVYPDPPVLRQPAAAQPGRGGG